MERIYEQSASSDHTAVQPLRVIGGYLASGCQRLAVSIKDLSASYASVCMIKVPLIRFCVSFILLISGTCRHVPPPPPPVCLLL